MKIGLLLATIFMCALLVEGAAALLGIHLDASFHTPERDRGWAYRPGAHGWNTSEGRAYVRINSDGERDDERPVAKPLDTYRIAVLGDSFTAALNVDKDRTFWSVLARKLGECGAFGGKKIEALDFGVGGYGTAQELITLRTRVWKYDPDMVLLAFYPGNDVLNNEQRVNPNNGEDAPYFVFKEGTLVLDEPSRQRHAPDPARLYIRNAFADVMNRSELLLVFATLRRSFLSGAAKASAEDRPNPEAVLLPFVPPRDEAMRSAWRVTEALLTAMRDDVSEHRADFRIVTLSTAEQVDPQVEHREEWKKKLGVPDLYYQEARLRALADTEGLRLLALGPIMAGRAEKTKEVFHFNGEGHWNPDGHRAAGEIIAADYCAPAPLQDHPGQ